MLVFPMPNMGEATQGTAIKFETTPFAGLKICRTQRPQDLRGSFLKTFHHDIFAEQDCALSIREQFFTISHRHVIRGMHFQAPPADHAKLIYCLHGSILDVVLDLRTGQPTYGQAFSVHLTADCGMGLFIPTGFAHGFLALEDDSTALYSVGSTHEPRLDSGIRWDSFGFDWPVQHPVLSDRDKAFPALADCQSPFV